MLGWIGTTGWPAGDEGVDHQARGVRRIRRTDGDGQFGRGGRLAQAGKQFGETGGIVARLEASQDGARRVEDADGVAGAAPVETGMEWHGWHLSRSLPRRSARDDGFDLDEQLAGAGSGGGGAAGAAGAKAVAELHARLVPMVRPGECGSEQGAP